MKHTETLAQEMPRHRHTWRVFGVLLGLALLVGCAGQRIPRNQAVQRGVYHQVQRGQTLWGIAQAYGTTPQALAQANRLVLSDTLQVGQRLYVPGATKAQTALSRCPCGPNADEAGEKSVPPSASRPSSPGSETSSSHLERANPEEMRFAWPLEGVVSRGFERDGERRHDGIDILSPKDTPIRAAADGEVIFSDWGPGGYGQLVIVRHSHSMVTLYAHNERNHVRVGQMVRRGDHIADVGKTGRATGYHVHFEIRQKAVPVSPLKHLSPPRHLVQLGPR